MAKKKSEKKPIEQYEHKGKERINNPPVGLVTPETDKETGKKKYSYDPHVDPALQFDSQRSQIEKIINDGLNAETLEEAKAALHELKKRQAPYLNWAGKAEHTSFEIPTVSLHVHERIDPRTIIETVRKRNGQSYEQLSLFKTKEENPPLREAIEFYKHKHNWTNRLIAGDSLLVMNSLIEKEGLSGKVQMIYFDPPYGIKYGSNFQPFVNKRDVKDGKDEDLTAEPEMIKAFRDTWVLGIHSYLTYLRDRLLLARELLQESGSIFVQISDENVHHVRELMDEVLGSENYVVKIFFKKTSGQASKLLSTSCDFLLWYAKDISKIKYRQIFKEKDTGELMSYSLIESPNGKEWRKMSKEEIKDNSLVPKGWRIFSAQNLRSQGSSSNSTVEFEFKGQKFYCGDNNHWKTTPDGLKKLVDKNRLIAFGNNLNYKRFIDDFPVIPLNENWDDTAIAGFSGEDKVYVVQTAMKVITRSLLMTTDPGDLVLDITCGSGTTAYVAENWGRRWITCDTSRVAITLAKQRLMTALFDYYELAHPEEGVRSGFRYKTVPHITLKSIANNEPPAQETLYDQPLLDKSRARVTGPFTVEAVPASTVKPLSDIDTAGTGFKPAPTEDIARSGETLRQAEWRDELLKCGIRGKNNQKILFSRVEPLHGTRWLHAEAETKPNDLGSDSVRDPDIMYGKPQRVVISFGSEYAPLEQRQVSLAIEEAQRLVPKPGIIVFASFQFDPEAAKDIDETNWPGTTLLKVQMNTDLLTDDLKKKRASNESFWLIGQPDVKLVKMKEGKDKGKYLVEVHGFDYYNTKTGIIESGGTERIALWMLDTDYDGRSLFPRQVFFPMSGEKDGWSRLAKNLKAEIDEELIEAYRGTISLPFESDKHKRIAVKIVDDRGIESLKIIEIV